ncbi:DUF3054 domain-containing protein [Gulosibacter chungangensis]|uniref:DUF3054 domain-containing protein n=1 Tax=Gulosibacter chungangensis TaxID=979746 RepID=A0A7J5B8J9_9MICO|nr:DUF3054 domain-containing protein [Gulosibacter chungangensis]KAB1641651.1 DUF3054 domain-containing protein [Gulosibacter chungangensis]
MQKLRRAYTRNSWIPFVVDVVLVIVFAIAGRSSHAQTLGVIEVFVTAGPFLGALLIAWLIVKLTKMQPSAPWPTGILIFAVTVTSGLALRILFGATAALPFILVTAGVLAVFLILPRLLLHAKREVEAID